MMIHFYSVDNDNNKVSFKSEGYESNGKLCFLDKTIKDTMIYLTISTDKLLFERKGRIEMVLPLQQEIKSKAYYKNELGLEFDFIADCTKLEINRDRIDIQYDMILDNEVQSSHKIWIILR